MTVQKKIKEYLKKEEAFVPRYKHEMGEHPQKRHGNRGTVHQETPGGRAVGGVTTIGINTETYAGGQFLPSTTMQKMASTARKYEKKYATEEEKYLNTKQEIQPYVWEKPPSTDHDSFHRRINGFIPHSGYRETFRYDTERARAMKPPYPNKQIVKQAERDATGKVIVYHDSKWVPMTREEWIKEIELAEKFNRGERWETGYDTARAKRKIHDMVYAFVKEGHSADTIKSFFAGQNTQGRDIDNLIYRSGILVDQNNGNYVYGNW